jgi:translocation and assembly module TamB
MEKAEAKKPRKKSPLWLRISFSLMGLVLVLLATAVALRFWITSDAGRAFITSQIDGRKLGPLGTVRISGLKGDPLDAATFADIALVDDEGVWLRARDVRIEWTPTALFLGELEIRKIGVGIVDVFRSPTVAVQESGGPGPDVGLRLDELNVETLRLDQPVLGVEARYALGGAIASPRNGAGFARLALSPRSGPADTANITLEWTPEGALKGLANIAGPHDGLIASLLMAPEEKSVGFVGKLDGTVDRFAGEGTLSFGGVAAAHLSLARAGDNATLGGELRGEPWPLLDPLFERTGGSVTFNGKANVADLTATPFTLDISAPAGAATLVANANLETFALPSPVAIDAKRLDLARLAPPLTGLADAKGELTLDLPADFVWAGDIAVTQLVFPSGSAAAVSGPVRVTKDGSSVSWRSNALALQGARIDALPDLSPARYTAASAGEFNLRTGALEFYDTRIDGAAGSATARGTLSTRTGAMELNGAARLLRLQDLAPVSGGANARWSVRQSSPNAPLRIEAAADGRKLSFDIEGFDALIGPTPHVEINGVVRGGRFALEAGTIESAGLDAEMTGRISDSGVIDGSASGRLSRSLELGGVMFRQAIFSADIAGAIEAPRIDADVSGADIVVAGTSISDVSGRATLVMGKTLTGDFALTGEALGQRLNTSGEIASGEGDIRINNLVADLGQLRARASRLSFGEDGVVAKFTAIGQLAGLSGLQSGALTLSGDVTMGETLDVAISGNVADLRSGAARIDLIAFEGTADDDRVNLSANLRGRVTTPVQLALDLEGRRDGEVWAGEATLDGDVDGLAVKTAKPVQWRVAPDGWSADALLAAFGGTLDARLASTQTTSTATAELRDVNLRAVSRLARISPVNGKVTGSFAFNNGATGATGDLRLAIENANPVGVTANPVSLDVRASLRNGVLTSESTGSGQGFSLEARSRLPMRVGAGFDVGVDPTRELASDVMLTGRAEQVWALVGPENQSMRGELHASMRAGGSLSAITLMGGFEVKDGAYEHGETGLLLDDIDAIGEFNQRSARITKFEATDGNGGRLSALGALDWTGDAAGEITFTARDLRALGRDDRFAIVSGQGALELGAKAITVTGDLVIDQARISVEQPAAASIPTLPGLRRVNFPNQVEALPEESDAPWLRPVQLDLKVKADRRIVVFGRGLDTEWAANFRITGAIADPSIEGTATMVRGSLDLGGRRFNFDTGTISLDGPIRLARIDIAADRVADDITASVRVSGTPVDPKFTLESTPSLPQDEVLARVLFGRSAAELSGLEAAQLAAGLAQLAGGQAVFDPIGLVREATGLDRISVGAEDGAATVSAGKYIAEDVYLQVGTGGSGGVAAEVEWEPVDGLAIISSATGNGDTKISVRWKKDYGAPTAPEPEKPAETEKK